MTHSVTVICNRCAATTAADWAPGAKKLFPLEDGWCYIGRGINLCPACTAGLNAWLERRPQPPTPTPPAAGVAHTYEITGASHLLDVDADGRITADDAVPARMPARQVTS